MPEYCVELIRFDSADDLAESAADRWVHWIHHSAHLNPRIVALPGGRIMRAVLTRAAMLMRLHRSPIGHIHFVWGDERCVGPTHKESNYRLARDLLLEPLHVPAKNIHRIHGELSPAKAARQASEELRSLSPAEDGEVPKLDLLILGMGEDGHVASLFPGQVGATSSEPYLSVTSPKPPPRRITLSLKEICRARTVWVLASGVGKGEALRDSLMGGQTPLAEVLRSREKTIVMTDIKL